MLLVQTAQQSGKVGGARSTTVEPATKATNHAPRNLVTPTYDGGGEKSRQTVHVHAKKGFRWQHVSNELIRLCRLSRARKGARFFSHAHTVLACRVGRYRGLP